MTYGYLLVNFSLWNIIFIEHIDLLFGHFCVYKNDVYVYITIYSRRE